MRPAAPTAFGEQAAVEGQGRDEAGVGEVSARIPIPQQRLIDLKPEGQKLLELIQRQQDGVVIAARHTLDRMHGPLPFGPVLGRGVEAGPRQQILAIEQQPRVDIPGRGHGAAGDFVGLQHGRKLVGQQVRRLGRGRRQGADGGQLRHPGIADLADVRQRGPGIGGQQLLMRGRPRQGLDRDPDARIAALELGHQLADRPAFVAHGPEAQHGLAVTTRGAGRSRPSRHQGQSATSIKMGPGRRQTHPFIQPPVKPAMSSARRILGSPRM